MVVSSNRTLGIVATCFILIGVIGSVITAVQLAYAGELAANLAAAAISGIIGIFSFLGTILFWVAMFGFSRDYQERRIFNYILYGIVITVVVAVAAAAFMFAYLFANIGSIATGLNPNPSQSDISTLLSPYISPFITIFEFIGLIYVVFEVLAFNLLSQKTSVPLFKHGARLLLLGGILSIVIGLVAVASMTVDTQNLTLIMLPGSLVQYVGWALLAMAFFRIKPSSQQTYSGYNAVPAPTSTQVRVCTSCGAQNLPDALYCARCGQKLS
ncbi:MAG: DUF996 domain-containing protein [Candidatus Bathyarchaeota archaeon]|nr:DUF996 domain-containing protein [Candidatus Bathyarchaeota archaeon]